MKLVVGLGNPGKEYNNTRHNIGFMTLDNFLGKVDWKTRLESLVYIKDIDDEQVIFAKPITYMNLSGLAVKKIVNYYKIPIENILIIQDDIDLPLGEYKLKRNSSSGGHNGIKSIISELDTEEFARLKIGIGKNDKIPVDRYVLGKFSTKEMDLIKENFDDFNKIIEMFIKEGLEELFANY